MDNPVPGPEQPPIPEDYKPDLVVIDRTALTRMLEAVINVLDATKGLEVIQGNPEITPEQMEQASFDLAKVREALSQGITQMQESVNNLPTVQIKQEG